mmetsp:Transcript_52348/g.119227  ORF Transcript_52348/g.119227 Transcript_52348/m.119227 type:complete len:314 (-) Transcript_52348:440-1381(-)
MVFHHVRHDNWSDASTEASQPGVSSAVQSIWGQLSQSHGASPLEVKNTFVHVGEQRLCERKFHSAPASVDLSLFLGGGGEVGLHPVGGVVDHAVDEPTPVARWDGGEYQRNQRETALGSEIAWACSVASRVVMDHLVVAEGGSVSLATLGNRISRASLAVFKRYGIRFSDFVRSLPGVEVEAADARLSGVIVPAKLHTRQQRRGEFLQRLRAGTLSLDQVDGVVSVVSVVHSLISESDGKQQSSFTLGNALPPLCRAFLKHQNLRLMEVLGEFPHVFRFGRRVAKPVVRLAKHSAGALLGVRDEVLAKLSGSA